MHDSFRISNTMALGGFVSALFLTVNSAAQETKSERTELASVEEGTSASWPSEGETSQPAYQAEPDSANTATQSATENRGPRLGGHVGIATPYVTIARETTTIADAFTLLHPIGISVKFERITVDFETVVVNPIDPSGQVGLVIDPGVVYNFGPVAAGLRLAWQQAESNFGLIPLVNKGIVDFEAATWFVEAAFPTFYADSTVQFNMVFHTGVGF
jgi:hypothetical protein